MRVNIAAVFVALCATSAKAGVIGIMPRNISIVADVGSVINQLTNGLPVNETDLKLDNLLGSAATKLESNLGVSFATKLVDLGQSGTSNSSLQAIGQAVAQLVSGFSLNNVQSSLTNATGGAVTNLASTLGVTDIQKALGLTQ